MGVWAAVAATLDWQLDDPGTPDAWSVGVRYGFSSLSIGGESSEIS